MVTGIPTFRLILEELAQNDFTKGFDFEAVDVYVRESRHDFCAGFDSFQESNIFKVINNVA